MRLFIAIPTTKEVNNQISEELKDVRQKLKGQDIRYQHPEKWHFTLIFLGEQDESQFEKIKSGIKSSLPEIKPIDIELEEIKYNPGRDPRMIWAITSEDTSRELGSIKGKITRELEIEGVSWNRNKRTYKGHITLARFDFNEQNELRDIKKSIDIKYRSPSIQLIKSELKPEGSKYTTLEKFEIREN